MIRTAFGWSLLFLAWAVPSHASLVSIASNCWQSDGTSNFLGPQDCSMVTGTNSASNNTTMTTPNPGNPNQQYNGSASVTATPDTYHLDASATLSNYLPGMYQFTPIDGIPFEASPSDARAILTDGIMVSGGTGVYNLSLILQVQGQITQSVNPDLFAEFCASLYLPQGTPGSSYSCEQNVQTGFNTVTLTYSDLNFAQGLITPTLVLDASVDTLYPPPTLGLVSGTAEANFADTITIRDLLITDGNGEPIPGITLTSQNGYSYPLDPANAVPEPSLLFPLCAVSGFLWAAYRWKRAAKFAPQFDSGVLKEPFSLTPAASIHGPVDSGSAIEEIANR